MADAPMTPDVRARNWAVGCHLLGLVVFVGAPFGNILGPLIVYLVKKDEDPFIALAAREALNFQISISIYGIILFVTYVATFFWTFLSLLQVPCKAHPPMVIFIFPLFFVALVLFDVVSIVVAATQSGLGKPFRYPVTLRFVR